MRSEIFAGRYVFHFHTCHTDGRSTIEDYVECAAAYAVERLIFLEHIRRVPSYNVPSYARAVQAAADRCGVTVHLGFEAKLLPDGTLDIAAAHAACAAVLGLAEHGFPADFELLRSAFRQAVTRTREAYPDKEIVWAHPGLWFKKHRRLEELHEVYLEMVAHAQAAGLRIERNRRHRLISGGALAAVAPGNLVEGLDAHSVREMVQALSEIAPP